MIAAEAAEHRIVEQLLIAETVADVSLVNLRLESELLGIPLVELLQERDLISEADVARTYAELSGLRFLDLTRRTASAAWVLTLPENIARLKDCVVFGEVAGQLVAAISDPIDPSIRTSISSRFDRPIQFVVSPRFQIRSTIDRVYGTSRAKGAGVSSATPLTTPTVTTSATGLKMNEQLDSVIDQALDRRASDIHIEPEHDRLRIRLRVDGSLVETRAFPLDAAAALISRVKGLAGLDITERRKPQDGRFSHRSFDQEIDIRVAVIPGSRGERATLRLLSKDRSGLTLGHLGMGSELRQAFERLIHRAHGMIVLTGPTGSGKTTTLYAALQRINSVDKHIITIEDPVEYSIAGVNQVAVDPDFGVSFARALRSILRHDPDVIMVGEIRDKETAHLALEASLTGHLVFATLHTNSAVGAVTRLLDMGCEPYLVASALIGVMAQRLVRRICQNCRKPSDATETERRLLRLPANREAIKVFRGAGCSRCLRTGYYDRVGIYEFVPFDVEMAQFAMDKRTTEELEAHAISRGDITLRDDATTKVLDGLTTLEDALRVTAHIE